MQQILLLLLPLVKNLIILRINKHYRMDITEINNNLNSKVRHPWELARFEVVFSIISKHIEKLEEKELLIYDIGCGDTFFSEMLSQRLPKCRIFAVDTAFTAEMLEFYSQKYQNSNIRVFPNVEQISINEKADLVLLLDVIEHIEDDITFLAWLRNCQNLSDDCKIAITVPAFQSLFTSHDVFLKHYRRYNNSLLTKNIRTAGFEIEDKGYFFTTLVFPRLLKTLIEKLQKPKKINEKGVGNWKGSNSMASLIKNILYLDYKISSFVNKIGIKVPGLSNYAICKKPV